MSAAEPLRPYADWADAYLGAGWSPIVLPRRKKAPPPDGYTGETGADVTDADVQRWSEETPGGNIGVRMPPNAIGLDVDVYDAKHGDDTIAKLASKYGELPPTIVTSAREHGGIYWYRIPPGCKLPGQLGPGVEVIQHHHRYAVVPPSWNPKAEAAYRAYDERTDDELEPASWSLEDLPELPDEWLSVRPLGQTRDATVGSTALNKTTELTASDVLAWFAEHDGPMCRATRKVLDLERTKLDAAVLNGDSRYDTARDGAMALVRLAAEGHHGTRRAVASLKALYEDAVAGEPNRDKSEWRRLVLGAVSAVAGLEEPAHPEGACPFPSDGSPADPSRWPAPSAPLMVAERYTALYWPKSTLRRWRGDFYRWQTTHWATVSDEAIHNSLYRALADATYMGAGQQPTELRWNPSDARLRAVVKALTGTEGVYLTDDVEPDSDGCMSLLNGVLDPETGVLGPHTVERFNLTALPFEYDPLADCPRWLAFLASLWPGSTEEAAMLAEWFGYVLAGDTRAQKALLILGPRRSGKGTIGRVLTALLGMDNVCAPTLSRMGGTFGLQQFLGKSLAVVGDAEASSQAARNAVDELKTIIGEDVVTVHRKNRDDWTGRLPVRFTLMANNVPAFLDSSGAMAERLLPLRLTETFAGREDVGLEVALADELPGVLNWALLGLQRLRARDLRFELPASSRELKRAIYEDFSPVRAYLNERCVKDELGMVERGELYLDYQDWCTAVGRRAVTREAFGRDLRSILPLVMGNGNAVWLGGERVRVYFGLRLRSE